MIAKIFLMYVLFAGSIGAILYGIPALRGVAIVHKTRVALAVGAGFILVMVVSMLEMAN